MLEWCEFFHYYFNLVGVSSAYIGWGNTAPHYLVVKHIEQNNYAGTCRLSIFDYLRFFIMIFLSLRNLFYVTY